MRQKNVEIYAVDVKASDFRPKAGQYEHPKIIHFIWHSKEMPFEMITNLLSVTRLASMCGYQVKLWVDHEKHLTRALEKELGSDSIPHLEVESLDKMDDIIDANFTPEHALKINEES